jgi:hypothetical protein
MSTGLPEHYQYKHSELGVLYPLGGRYALNLAQLPSTTSEWQHE